MPFFVLLILPNYRTIFIINSITTSPYPGFLAHLFQSKSIVAFFHRLIGHTLGNTMLFFVDGTAMPTEIFQRYFIFFTLIFLIFKSRIIQSKLKNCDHIYLLALFNLGAILLITITVYDIMDWRDYRVMAPLLFGAIFWITLSIKNNKLIYIAIGANILFLSFFVIGQKTDTNKNFFDKARYSAIKVNQDLAVLEYDANPQSPLDNTIVIAIKNFEMNDFYTIPAGIGVSFFQIDLRRAPHFRPRYIYWEGKFLLEGYEEVSSSSKGELYIRKN